MPPTRRTILSASLSTVILVHHKPGHDPKPTPTPSTTGYGNAPYGAAPYGA